MPLTITKVTVADKAKGGPVGPTHQRDPSNLKLHGMIQGPSAR